MAAYYNELDPNAAAWLRELIKQGLIADGEVDERSVTDVSSDELRGFNQCHFFAGIGGWSYALRLAGVPDDYPVWTASLPCQPFSAAGKQLGKADERHLLPHFLGLVRQCQPDRIFGEQVEGAIRHGWLDDLQTTMEAEGYAIGHCVLGAHSVGAFHQRQRLYWVADAKHTASIKRCQPAMQRGWQGNPEQAWMVGGIDGLADNIRNRPQGRIFGWKSDGQQAGGETGPGGADSWLEFSESEQVGLSGQPRQRRTADDGMVHTYIDGRKQGSETTKATGYRCPFDAASGVDWIYCRDNKYRPIKSGLEPLVDGVSERLVRSGNPGAPIDADQTQEARVMRLKGFGNAIVPQVAAEFIGAFMQTLC